MLRRRGAPHYIIKRRGSPSHRTLQCMTTAFDSVIPLTLTSVVDTQCSLLFTLSGIFTDDTRPFPPPLICVMPFLAEEHIDIPTTDLLSWMFDGQTYDADKPVFAPRKFVFTVTDAARFMSMLPSQPGQYPRTRQEVLQRSYALASNHLG